MKEAEFVSRMAYAEKMKESELDRNRYWTMYIHGLKRRHLGTEYGTDEEHQQRLDNVFSRDPGQAEEGRGYIDGLTEVPLAEALCVRCGHTWRTRMYHDAQRSRTCPNCKTVYWDKPKKPPIRPRPSKKRPEVEEWDTASHKNV